MTTAESIIPDLWDDQVAPDDPVEQLIYPSRLLGTDLRVTNFAGGNTISKSAALDVVNGAPASTCGSRARAAISGP